MLKFSFPKKPEDFSVIGTILASLLLLQGPQFIQPGGVSGQIRTINGVPAVAVRVVAMPVPRGITVPDDGPNYFILAPPTGVALTDNEGNYLFRDLAPGNYYIIAGVPGQATYYPGVEDLRSAGSVSVQSAIIAENTNFSLLHRLGGKLSGRVNANMAALGPRTATIIGGKLDDILEVPVQANGTFEFGHVPPGKYLLSLYPPTPGIASVPVTVGDEDVSGMELVPLPTHRVTGRIVVKNGPIPYGILGFYTEKTYVGGTINPDGTFSVQLHAANHQIDFAGLPVGYSLDSVRVGSRDVTQGLTVGNADLSDVVITLNAPGRLAVLRGRVTGLPANRYATTVVELAGPIFSRLQADVQQNGTFEFPAVTPGLYTLTLSGVRELAPMTVAIDGFRTFELTVAVPGR
jgi:hypothetical protein